jgi:hypothetical protein
VSITKAVKLLAFANEFRIELDPERQINEASELIGELIAFLHSARLEDENKEFSKNASFRVRND